MANNILTEAYLELRAKLHRVALAMLKDDADAQDAMQDAFCNLWRAAPVASDAEAKAKLMVVLRNVCVNRLRKPQVLSVDSAGVEVADAPGQYEAPEIQADRLLGVLSPVQRQIVRMAIYDNYEYDIIALRMNMTVEAVRMNMCRARKKMYETYKTLK